MKVKECKYCLLTRINKPNINSQAYLTLEFCSSNLLDYNCLIIIIMLNSVFIWVFACFPLPYSIAGNDPLNKPIQSYVRLY